MKAIKNRLVRDGKWLAASLAVLLFILLNVIIALVGISVAALALTAYLWCLWNFTALTIAVGCSFLMLVFLITNTTIFDGIFEG